METKLSVHSTHDKATSSEELFAETSDDKYRKFAFAPVNKALRYTKCLVYIYLIQSMQVISGLLGFI